MHPEKIVNLSNDEKIMRIRKLAEDLNQRDNWGSLSAIECLGMLEDLFSVPKAFRMIEAKRVKGDDYIVLLRGYTQKVVNNFFNFNEDFKQIGGK